MLKDIKAKLYKDGKYSMIDEVVAIEAPVKIICGDYSIDLFATPFELEDMAIGHLAAKGFVSCADDIEALDIEKDGKNGFIINAEVKCRKREATVCKSAILRPEAVVAMNDHVGNNAELFFRSAALHYAYLFDDDGGILWSAYDIGRMNAIDKVLGKCLGDGQGFGGKVIYTTGRIASRTVEKAANTGIALLVSKAPPMYEAIGYAKERGITLIGFSRDRRFTIYTE